MLLLTIHRNSWSFIYTHTIIIALLAVSEMNLKAEHGTADLEELTKETIE